ncbi:MULTISPECIES: MotB family protein [unclassified Ensifer]|uniref:MotB family protein n=1 Tax=unclassified Ensifer TaxID=2633371 RepID=UPI000813B0FB|nr:MULTISPECIES: MotB family protein [unclassified Ensifer]OCP04931.1 flagellar motor protein MotB [Ensifer sp. LC14]OCP08655.1 flagellar motor protein MotB [Ensifer sp. LC11]OCP09914.1 flagellar motor protein MotB [Ensifer sp. LC13]OCP33127.1 flagellar motor protein MotB [Ensifer sp. LC499]
MSDENHHNGKHEIIIVKRHSGGHDGHHGGSWKIAYADFMTAMMAFFLVMWLINAANEETKAAIASYFNPVQLTDQKPAERGLKDPAKDAQGEETQQRSKVDGEQEKSGGSAKTGDQLTATSGEETKYSDADFFENPYSVLSEIAREVGQQANISVKGEGGAAQSGPATGADGGEAYRDPFDPDFWTKQVELKDAGNTAETDVALAAKTTEPAGATPAVKTQTEAEGAQEASEAVTAADKGPEKATDKGADTAADDKPKAETKEADAEKQAAELQAELKKELAGEAGQLAEGLVVTPAEGGLMVTISERTDAQMFAIGSAVPQKELVLAMEKIGHLLAGRQGAVAIRGHTDGRPFKDGTYDNWRLSAARAQSAYYMLVRGGLKENRVSQISGFADRRLQLPDDPYAPGNRRIEILLQSAPG